MTTARPIRIQRKRTKGWKMPPNTVYVGRGSAIWGNPYSIGRLGNNHIVYGQCSDVFFRSRHEAQSFAVQAYRTLLNSDTPHAHVVRGNLHELRGKDLACWCNPGSPCHADVLLELANPKATP